MAKTNVAHRKRSPSSKPKPKNAGLKNGSNEVKVNKPAYKPRFQKGVKRPRADSAENDEKLTNQVPVVDHIKLPYDDFDDPVDLEGSSSAPVKRRKTAGYMKEFSKSAVFNGLNNYIDHREKGRKVKIFEERPIRPKKKNIAAKKRKYKRRRK